MTRSFLLSLAGSLGQLVLGLGTSVLLARLLGPALRGDLAAVQLFPSQLLALALVGTPHSLAFYTARHPGKSGELLGAALVLSLVGTVLACLVGMPLSSLVLSSRAPSVQLAGLLYFLFIPVAVAYGLPWSSFLGRQDFVSFNTVKLLPGFAYLAATAVAYFWPTAFAVTVAHLVCLLIVVVPVVWVVYAHRVGQKIVFRLRALRLIAKYSFVSMAVSLPQVASQRIEFVFVLSRLSASSAGFYAVAMAAGQIVQASISSMGAVILPKIAASSQASGEASFGRLFRISFVAVGGLVVCSMVLVPPAIPILFGTAYRESAHSAPLLVVAAGLTGINQVLSDGFRGLGKPHLVFKTELLSLVAKVGLIFVLLAKFDLPRAAGVALVGPAAALMLNIFFFNRHVHTISVRWLMLVKADMKILLNGIVSGVRSRLWGRGA